MKLFAITLEAAIKRPFAFLATAFITLIFLYVNSYNPLLGLVMGFTQITGGDALQSIVSVLQVLSDADIVYPILAIFLIGGVLVSVFFGALISGVFFILNNYLEGKNKVKNEFILGVKKNFKKVLFITFKSILVIAAAACFLLIACVPSIVITKAAASNKENLFAIAIFLNTVTLFVLFFMVMFIKIYISFWYAAAFSTSEKYFISGKKAADMNFWNNFLVYMLFDFVFVFVQYMLWLIRKSPAAFFINWVFISLFLFAYAMYVLSTYKKAAAETAKK